MHDTTAETKAKILIVDNEVLIATDLSSRMEGLGYMVCGQVTSGEQALAMVEQHQPDLVLMDIVLQGEMDGIDTAEVIKDKWGIPVVFLTAYTDTDRLERAKLTYPFGYLLKPFQDRDLKITVEMSLYIGKVDKERKQIEAALRKSEERYRKAQAIGHVGSWEYNIQTTEFWGSDEAKRIYGFDVNSTFLSTDDVENCIPERERVHQALVDFIESGKEYDLQFDIITYDKKVRKTIISKADLERDETGRPLKITGVIQDITDRKQAEEALARSRNELEEEIVRRRMLFEQSPDGVLIIDTKTLGFVEFNTAAHLQLGYSREEFARLTIADIEASETPEETMDRIKQVIRDGRADFETLQRTRTGEIRNVHVTAQIVRFERLELYQCIWRDITDRKLAEKSLSESEEKYRTLFENMEQGVFYRRYDGVFMDANEATLRIFGLTRDQFLGRTSIRPEWKVIHEDGSDFLSEEHPSMVALKTGQPVKDVVVGVYNHLNKNYSWIILNAIPLFRPGEEKPYQAFVTIHDITAHKRAEEALIKSERNLRETIDATPFPIAVVDLQDDQIFYWSRSAITTFGHTAPSTSEWYEIAYPDPDYRQEVINRWKPFLDIARETGQAVNTGEYQITCKDGSFRICELYATFLSDNLIVTFNDITKRKQAEDELRKSVKDLRESQRIAHVGSWRLDIATNEVVWTDELYKMYGFDPALPPPPYTEHMKLFTPESWEQLSVALARTVDSGVPYELELETVKEDGSNGWMWARGEVVENEEGKITGLWGAAQDITERRKAEVVLKAREEELAKTNERFKLATDSARIGVWDLDLKTDALVWDDWMYRLYGIDPKHFRGAYEAWKQSVHPDDVVRMDEEVQMAIRGENVFDTEFRVVMPSGEIRHMKAFAKVHQDETGEPARMTGINFDITDRKKAEEALRESEERFQQLFDNMGDGVAVYQAIDDGNDFVFVDINRPGQILSKISKDKAVGMRITAAFPAVGEIGLLDVFRSVYLTGQPEHLSMRSYEDDRVQQWVENYVFKLPSGLIVALYSDSTEKQRAEQEKQKLQAQFQQAQKMEAIGTLAGGIAHDFNNLLQAISGYTQLLLMEKSETDPDYQSLIAIQGAGFRASALVGQLLLFSRKAESTRRLIELQNEVEQAKKILERTIPKMVEIQVIVGNRLWAINADPVQIEQMLLNLGTNAADAMPDGGKLLFEIKNVILDDNYTSRHLNVQPGGYVLLSVSDTGHGMDKETMEKIFEPFYTTKEFGKGTGLGLASVYGIVKSHDGNITCYSEVGQGTTFRIYFPAIIPPEVEETKVVEHRPIPRGTETILLVDDEEAIRRFAEQALTKFGYTVMTASTGEEALKLYSSKTNKIDLLVMDLGMPGMGGYKCLQELLKINPKQKVIIASGYSINGQVKQSMDAGAKGYVGKPYQLSDLLNTVKAVLDEEG